VAIARLSPSYELLLPGFDAAEVHHLAVVVDDFPELVEKEATCHVTETVVVIWEEYRQQSAVCEPLRWMCEWERLLRVSKAHRH
jgi:hypothetical protein